MSAMEITRLFEKVVRLGETADSLLDRILRLEARVEELERYEQKRLDKAWDEKHTLPIVSSDQEIVERWKAGGCTVCGGSDRGGYDYSHGECLHRLEGSELDEWRRLVTLCDAAVKEGK